MRDFSKISVSLNAISPGEEAFALPRESSFGIGGFFLQLIGADWPVFMPGEISEYQGLKVGSGKLLVCAPNRGIAIFDLEAGSCCRSKMPYAGISLINGNLCFWGIGHPIDGSEPDKIFLDLEKSIATLRLSGETDREPVLLLFEKMQVKRIANSRAN